MLGVAGIGLWVTMLAAAPANDDAAAAVVRDFYGTYISVHAPGGLPTARELPKLRRFLSPRLRRFIEEARRYSEEYERRHPDEKPPFVDGDLFCSNFEGASRAEVEAVEPRPSGYRVLVRFEYGGTPHSGDVIRWKDAILVIKSRGRWLIDDVEYLAEWPFANRGRLSEVLRAR